MILDKVTKEEKNIVELEITVPADEFEKAVEASYRKNVGKMNIPGFRKGKAPRKMIEKMYGETVFHEDAINAVYPAAYDDAVKEAGIEPVDHPVLDVISNDENGFKFKARITVKPEVSVKDYKGIKVEKHTKTVSDADIQAELERYQQRQARLIDLEEDAAIENGDTVTFDFKGYVDDVPFEGGEAEKYTLKIGSGQFIPGFEEQMVGMKAGQEGAVNVTFPEEYHAEELKGKPARFDVKIHEIKRTELPAIDDELAKDVSDFDTLEEFKADLSKKIAERYEQAEENEVTEKVYAAVADCCEADIPACMIEHEIDSAMQGFERRMMQQGLSLQKYLEITGQEYNSLRDMFKVNAERDVKIRLALEKIAEIEKIIIEEEDVNKEYEMFAQETGTEVEKLKSDYVTESIIKDLSLRKAFEVVRNNAVVTEAVEAPAEEAPVEEKPKKRTRKKAEKAEEKPEETAESAE